MCHSRTRAAREPLQPRPLPVSALARRIPDRFGVWDTVRATARHSQAFGSHSCEVSPVLIADRLLDRDNHPRLVFPRTPLLAARLWEAKHASRFVSAAAAVTA